MEHTPNYRGPMQPYPGLEACAREITLARSGQRMFCYDAGPQAAPALLFVHGLGDEADSWRHLILTLAERQRVLALDLPGFGRSAPLPRYTLPTLEATLLDLLDTLEIPAVTLLGNSLGAMLCHALALTQPERVRGLVLMDGALAPQRQRPALGTLLFALPGMGEWLYTRLRKNPQAAYHSLRPFYAALDRLPQPDRDFLYQRVNERVWSDTQRRAYLHTLRAMPGWIAAMQRDLSWRLERLTIPTLVIFGAADAIVSVSSARALVEVQNSARLTLIPDAGHLPHQECPAAVLETLRSDARLAIR